MDDSETGPDNAAPPPPAEAQSGRPNANYRLSKESADEEQLVFYYNREERLAKAPQVVRDLYKKEEAPRRFGLFRSLVSTRPRAMMFGSIVMICAAILVLSILGYTSDAHDLDGNRVAIQAVRFEGAVIVTLKKTVQTGLFAREPYTGAVDIAVSPAARAGPAAGGGEGEAALPPVFIHRVFFTLEPAEEYRFAVPVDSGELVLVFHTEQKMLSVTIRPE
jgi:hypothetical protein